MIKIHQFLILKKQNQMLKKVILPIFASTIWISISEFVRNEFLLKETWSNHYSELGLSFPSDPINGAIWGVWSLVYAITIFVLLRKFSVLETTLISWVYGFVTMWLVVGNMMVLPFSILPFAIPLSILEAFLAALIIKKITEL